MMNVHVRDNLNALHTPAGFYTVVNKVSDNSLTSSSYADVDSTEFAATVTTGGGDMIICGSFYWDTNSAGAKQYLDILVDGVAYFGDDGQFIAVNDTSVSFQWRITGLSAASHTFKLRYKVSAGTTTLYMGAGTSTFDVHPVWFGFEI